MKVATFPTSYRFLGGIWPDDVSGCSVILISSVAVTSPDSGVVKVSTPRLW